MWTAIFTGCDLSGADLGPGSSSGGGSGHPYAAEERGSGHPYAAGERGSGLQGVPLSGDKITPSDYADNNNWMLLPKQNDKPVDIFYLYPTSWSVKDSSEYPVCSIDLKKMRKTAKSNAEKQASAFETVGNIYAPYYRQLAVAFILNRPAEDRADYFGGVPAADAIAAFDYYIRHYNNGRPFILAGHSQGAALIKEILFTYMKENPDVYSRMAAAYVIGYSVTEQEMTDHPWLKFAEGAEDTGVIISYNTESPELSGTNTILLPGSIAINPISWTRTATPAPADRNPGSYIKVNGEMTLVKKLADATVNPRRGTVICSSVSPAEFKSKNAAFFPAGVYHSFDIAFYYMSLRQNAQLRTDAFLQKNEVTQ